MFVHRPGTLGSLRDGARPGSAGQSNRSAASQERQQENAQSGQAQCAWLGDLRDCGAPERQVVQHDKRIPGMQPLMSAVLRVIPRDAPASTPYGVEMGADELSS